MCRNNYTPDRTWPLVMALHGGSGNGRGFLWSWLRDARQLWCHRRRAHRDRQYLGLDGGRHRHPNLKRILDFVRGRWNIDSNKLLLTGMSDGGTFCIRHGLESASPFTIWRPVAATFHPLMAE